MKSEHPAGTAPGRRCRDVAELLPAFIDDPDALAVLGDGAGEWHLGSCLRCQADLARYRRLRRTMRSMGADGFGPAPGPDLGSDRELALAKAIESVEIALDHSIGRRDRIRIAGRRTALLGGLAAATAAGFGGVLVLATRRRTA
jgi:hypothetical protein